MLAKGNNVTAILMLSVSLLLAACNDPRFASQQTPQIDLPGLIDKQRYRLEDFKGKVVYLTFWASWCAPCRMEMPFLVELHRQYADQGFQILAVNEDEDLQAAVAFIKPFQVPFPLLSDSDKVALKNFNVEGMPTHFIVDRSGMIRYSHMGFKETDKDVIAKQIGQLVRQKSPQLTN